MSISDERAALRAHLCALVDKCNDVETLTEVADILVEGILQGRTLAELPKPLAMN